MKKRQWAIIGGAAILVLAFLLKNYLADSAEQKAPLNRSQKKLVEYLELESGSVAIGIPIDGPVQALNKIELYSEVSGIVSASSAKFKEGRSYQKDEVLLELDPSEAKSAYRSARSNYLSLLSQILPDIKLDFPDRFDSYYRYLQSLSSSTDLPAPPIEANAQMKLFLGGRNLYSSFQNAKAALLRLEKFSIKAPFSGSLTAATVEPGQLVRAGQILGEYLGGGSFEMMASLSADEARMVKLGDAVQLQSSDGKRSFEGSVFRKNEKVDPATQRLSIYIRIDSDELTDGEYLKGKLEGQALANAMEIDRKLLIDEGSLFRIQDSSLVQVEISILHRDPQSVIIAAPMPRMQVPVGKIPGAYPGMKVRLIKAKSK